MNETQNPGPISQLLELPELNADTQSGTALVDPQADIFQYVKVKVTVRLGEAELALGDIRQWRAQDVVKLDRPADGPIDILVDGKVIARGELVAVDDNFGVRITEPPKVKQA